MEFPSLGKNCALTECKQLDFLPINCDSCNKVFCKDHVGYEQHNCTESYKKDKRVPVCPLCNQPVSIKPGEVPDRRVNEHIENDCKSDLALAKRKTYTNKCSVKGCKQRELVPVSCATCKKNFCLRHRHENDHECIGVAAASSNSRSHRSAASNAAGQAAASRFNSYNTSRKKEPQKSSLSTIGGDLNRERQLRSQQTTQNMMTQQHSIQTQQMGMTEDEALAFALQASLADTPNRSPEPKPLNQTALSEDDALAQAIAQSEIDERDRQRRAAQARANNKESACQIT